MTDPGLIKRYLLGTASADERTALEDKYLSDADAFEELTAAENDLIDSYSRGKLSDSEKRDFEKGYMATPKGRARVDFSRAFTEVSSEACQTAEVRSTSLWEVLRSYFQLRSRLFRWGLVATCAAIVAIVVGSRNVLHNRDLGAGLKYPQTQTPALTPPPTANPKGGTAGTETARNEAPRIAEFTMRLEPGLSRTVGSSTPEAFVAPSVTQWLNLQLVFEGDKGSTSYTAILETPEGREVDRIPRLKIQSPSGRAAFAVRLPVRLVPAGDYVVELKGQGNDSAEPETIESYSFRILYK